jgi:hypothetical protein
MELSRSPSAGSISLVALGILMYKTPAEHRHEPGLRRTSRFHPHPKEKPCRVLWRSFPLEIQCRGTALLAHSQRSFQLLYHAITLVLI